MSYEFLHHDLCEPTAARPDDNGFHLIDVTGRTPPAPTEPARVGAATGGR
jgi:hypothetical protein